MSYIRKISIGNDYKESMHYVVGQSILDKTYNIHAVNQLDDGSIQIWIEKECEIILWKSISQSMPKVIEYRIDL